MHCFKLVLLTMTDLANNAVIVYLTLYWNTDLDCLSLSLRLRLRLRQLLG